MGIRADTLFRHARDIELKVAALYEDLVQHLPPGGEEATFFASLAVQEHIHAAWAEEMGAAADPTFAFDQLEPADFENILGTIEDVHDEVLNKALAVPDTLEIVLHLEASVAENFYRRFPPEVPGLPRALVERMTRSCDDHQAMIMRFRQHCVDTGQAGMHGRRPQP